jgi:spore protease
LEHDHRAITALSAVHPDERRQVIDEVLVPTLGDLMVTPKEIDVLISEVARVVAGGLNVALHPEIDPDELSRYIG